MSQVLTDPPAQALSCLLTCGLLVLHTWALEASLCTHYLLDFLSSNVCPLDRDGA